MTTRLVRLAGANTPRRTVNKPHIVPPRDQALRLTLALNMGRVDHCGVAEAHTDLVTALRRDPVYDVTRARANDVFPRTRIGNATVTRVAGDHGWDRLDKRNLRLEGGDKPLHAGVVLSQRSSDEQQLTTVAGHLWSRPAATDAEWAAAAAELREYGETVDGGLALIADFNRGRAIVVRHFPARAGWRVLTFANVTGILVRGIDPRSERQITDGFWPEATDHREGLVTGAGAITDKRTMDRLPR